MRSEIIANSLYMYLFLQLLKIINNQIIEYKSQKGKKENYVENFDSIYRQQQKQNQ